LSQPSQGAVDNGAACAILLGLADRISNLHASRPISNTKVTIALFAGEEANMQGSRAYARSRDWPLPTVALNLEIMAQDGGYIFWEQDGYAFGLVPTFPEVNAAISEAIQEVTGQPAQPAGPVNSDGFSFLSAGIPTGVIGTYDTHLKMTGFHRPTDNINRVVYGAAAGRRGDPCPIYWQVRPSGNTKRPQVKFAHLRASTSSLSKRSIFLGKLASPDGKMLDFQDLSDRSLVH